MHGENGFGFRRSEELTEALKLLEKISKDNSPEKPAKENFAKTLALNIGQTAPVIYGFGFYRSVAQRFKQQFNENSKVPAKWEVFTELNHNEIVGWERAGELAQMLLCNFHPRQRGANGDSEAELK